VSTPAVPTALPRWVAASVALIAALVGISGCGADLADCADADCRLSTAEAAFADAPVDTLRLVAALPDPIEQAALIELLVHRYPEHGTTICGVAPAGSIAAERCARLTVRPHLFATERVSPLQPATVAPAAGPRADLPPPAGAAAPWLGLPVDEAALRATCGASSTCLQDAALERAGAADAVGAGQRCILAWPAGSAVGQECLFQVAERMMLARGAAVLEPALAVCAQTGNLASNCVQHVVLFTVPPATPADAPVAGAVQQATATAARLRALGGATAGAAYADLLWSVWLRECAVLARSPSGALAGWLPAEALPHLRMALAWQAALLHPPHTADASLDSARACDAGRHRVDEAVLACNWLFHHGCRGPPAPRPPAKGPAGPLGSPAKGGRGQASRGAWQRRAPARNAPLWKPPLGRSGVVTSRLGQINVKRVIFDELKPSQAAAG
jgi:hypothetical protein